MWPRTCLPTSEVPLRQLQHRGEQSETMSRSELSKTLQKLSLEIAAIREKVESKSLGADVLCTSNSDITENIAALGKRIDYLKKSLDLQISSHLRHVNGTTAHLAALCYSQQNTINWQGCLLANWQKWWEEQGNSYTCNFEQLPRQPPCENEEDAESEWVNVKVESESLQTKGAF